MYLLSSSFLLSCSSDFSENLHIKETYPAVSGRFSSLLPLRYPSLPSCYPQTLSLIHILQPYLADRNEDFTSAYDFDFVIGSTHLCRGMDPYYPEFFEKFSSEEEAIRAYFAETLENLQEHDDYDVLGHLDYIVRVAPSRDKNYSYDKYKDAIDPIPVSYTHLPISRINS